MMSGWNNLQVPLGSEGGLGRGTFTLASPSIATRSLVKEQAFFLRRSYGDGGHLEPNIDNTVFSESRTTLVENLVGALISATEILDGYAHPSCVSAAFKGFLGFEALSQDHSLALATDPGLAHAIPRAEHFQLLFHEKLRFGSSALALVSSPDDGNLPHGSLRLASNAHSLHLDRSSSPAGLGSGNISCGLSVDTIRSPDNGPSHHSDLPGSSEEDILLQEARYKALNSRCEPGEWKGVRQASSSSHGPVKLVGALPPHSKRAKDVTQCESQVALQGRAESGKAGPFAGFMTPRESSLFWGGIALSIFLAGFVFVTFRSSFIMRGQSQRPSVKRRILKSQWYGNPGSESRGHRNFEMRISEFPKYPILQVNGDKKLLHFPSDRSGTSATFGKSDSHLSCTTHADHVQPIGQVTNSKPTAQVSSPTIAHRKPIRQTVLGSKGLLVQQRGPDKAHLPTALNEKPLANRDWLSQSNLANDYNETRGVERIAESSVPRDMPLNNRAHGKAISREQSPSVKPDGRRLSASFQENVPTHTTSRMVTSKRRFDQSHWGKDDQLNLDRRIQKLFQTIQSVEQHRRAAMLALEEERQRSMALEEEMTKQREASAVLGEEVRLLKESHSALLTLLRKKYSTSAAARTAADLVYQDWERHAAAE